MPCGPAVVDLPALDAKLITRTLRTTCGHAIMAHALEVLVELKIVLAAELDRLLLLLRNNSWYAAPSSPTPWPWYTGCSGRAAGVPARCSGRAGQRAAGRHPLRRDVGRRNVLAPGQPPPRRARTFCTRCTPVLSLLGRCLGPAQ